MTYSEEKTQSIGTDPRTETDVKISRQVIKTVTKTVIYMLKKLSGNMEDIIKTKIEHLEVKITE